MDIFDVITSYTIMTVSIVTLAAAAAAYACDTISEDKPELKPAPVKIYTRNKEMERKKKC